MIVPKPRRLKNGRFYIYLRLGDSGISITEDTERACTRSAQLAKAEYLANKRIAGRRPKNDNTKKTLRQHCLEEIEMRRPMLSPSTIQGYEKVVDQNLQGIMDTRLCDLTSDMVRLEISKEMQKPGRRTGTTLSSKTLHNATGFLFPIIRKYNPGALDGVSLPELHHRPAQILRPEEVYETVRGTDIELPCLLAMRMTLTVSEIRGLTKSKSIHGDLLTVAEVVVDIHGAPVRKETAKEETRNRTLRIPPYIKALIDRVEGDVVCPLSSQALNKRLQRRLEKFGYPPISFHKLRHIAASTMISLGVPDDYILAEGGWKTPYVLNRTYKHLYAKEQQEYADKIDDRFDEFLKNVN